MEISYPLESNNEYPSLHAASVCKLPGGDVLVACYAGEKEGSKDSVILGNRYNSKTSSWESQDVWVNVQGKAVANPRLFLSPSQSEVWLLVGINYGRWCSGDTYLFLKRSSDGGETWTDLELLIERPGILGRNLPFQDDELLLIPAEYESSWTPVFLRSEDGGKSWKLKGDFDKGTNHLIQPAVVELSSGNLLAYLRSQEGYIFQTISKDRGKHWSTPESTTLPNNNSGIDLVSLENKKLLLAYNPTGIQKDLDKLSQKWPSDMPKDFDHWGPRTPLRIAISHNAGQEWRYKIDVEEGPGEYSYPTIIKGKDKLHLVYTYNRKSIKYISFTEEVVYSGKTEKSRTATG